MNIAKQGYEAYSNSQSDVSKTGGHEYNSGDNRPSGQTHGGPSFDDNEVVRNAEKHGSGSSDLFSSALSFLNNNKGEHQQPVDEDETQRAHNEVYNKGNTNVSANSIGSAAALQILKQFTSGSSGHSSGGGNSQTQLISMAMAEASKLFDKSGGASSGNKQDAVNGAAMTVMKLLVQSKFSGGTTGGSNSGGLGQLLSMASKFA